MNKKLALVTPGEILLKEFMQPLGISIDKLAHDIDLDVDCVSKILKAKRPIDDDVAKRLGKYFKTSTELWLNLQANYDSKLKQREENKE